jgi:hypothetical protein
MPPRTPAPSPAEAARRSRRAAQRRTAANLKTGQPVLPEKLRAAIRRDQARSLSSEVIERRVGDKPFAAAEVFGGGTFRQLHSYSPQTVEFMAGKMTGKQRTVALKVSAEEYQELASRQGVFNVFWYHRNDLGALEDAWQRSNH